MVLPFPSTGEGGLKAMPIDWVSVYPLPLRTSSWQPPSRPPSLQAPRPMLASHLTGKAFLLLGVVGCRSEVVAAPAGLWADNSTSRLSLHKCKREPLLLSRAPPLSTCRQLWSHEYWPHWKSCPLWSLHLPLLPALACWRHHPLWTGGCLTLSLDYIHQLLTIIQHKLFYIMSIEPILKCQLLCQK